MTNIVISAILPMFSKNSCTMFQHSIKVLLVSVKTNPSISKVKMYAFFNLTIFLLLANACSSEVKENQTTTTEETPTSSHSATTTTTITTTVCYKNACDSILPAWLLDLRLYAVHVNCTTCMRCVLRACGI